ncbi:MAG: Gfo/Idh/MocA family oxidoreductase [Spirochaetaceae bacterium]|nr:Gfo/Idh/MocA family oxidoreductase [Spirochaetaceae bacterium]
MNQEIDKFSDLKSQKNISVMIIGGGKISEQHLIALSVLKDITVTGICDLSPALSQFTAERFGIANWFTDYKSMLSECDAKVVHVLTPPATHKRIVKDCLESGRHVIVEKPIATSNKEFRELYDFALSKGLHLIENHNYRFNRPIVDLENAVREGKIGAVKEIEVRLLLNIGGGRYADSNLPHASHQLPAGVIHEFITHLAYLLLNFLPETDVDNFDKVRAAWQNHTGGSLFKYDDLDAFILSKDVHSRLRFSCHQWPDGFHVKICGTEGTAEAELFHPICHITTKRSIGQHLTPLFNSIDKAKAIRRAGFRSLWNKIRNKGAYEGLGKFLELTYKSFLNGEEPPVSFQQMDEASRLIDSLLLKENSL